MQRSSTGQVVQTAFQGIPVDAFVPEPLPPFPPLEMGELIGEAADAALALGRLDTISTLLPDANLFIYTFVRREAVLSSQIEGTRSSISDLLLFELDDAPGVPIDDVREVSNYVDALDYAVGQLRAGTRLDIQLLCEIHGILLDSNRGSDKDPGQLKGQLNWLNGRHPAEADFVPPPPDEARFCLQQLIDYISDDDGSPSLIRAGLAHVQFETIHPFLDGNGRVGRLLVSLMLTLSGALKQPILYLSLYLKQNRQSYYYLLNEVRRQGDWEAWLRFFLNGVQSTATTAVDMAQRLTELISEDRQRVRNELSHNASAQAVHQAFSQRPIHSIRGIAEMSGISWPTAAAAVERLVELGIVSERTGRRRNRIFAYDRYVEILSEDTEPI